MYSEYSSDWFKSESLMMAGSSKSCDASSDVMGSKVNGKKCTATRVLIFFLPV